VVGFDEELGDALAEGGFGGGAGVIEAGGGVKLGIGAGLGNEGLLGLIAKLLELDLAVLGGELPLIDLR
jgi:hypothetical protein